MKPKVIAIDFDGTLAVNKYPEIGDAVPNAIEACLELQKTHNLILLTMRDGKQLDEAVKWCEDRGVKFWGVNRNPTQFAWSKSKKVYAHIYIDDAGYGTPMIHTEGNKPYVDWSNVLKDING